jgi:hypothetical protein
MYSAKKISPIRLPSCIMNKFLGDRVMEANLDVEKYDLPNWLMIYQIGNFCMQMESLITV